MAMNKKEKAELLNYKELASLHITETVEPDLLPPKVSNNLALTVGYWPNSYSLKVTEACSSSVSHSSYRRVTTSKGPLIIYSSKLLALRGMRNELETRFAKQLNEVDELIEGEKLCQKGL